jgi:UDP-glucose 4-epimerase
MLMGTSNRTIKGKSVLVTGGSGFLGSHFIDLLISEEVKVLTVIDNFFLGTLSNLTDAYRRMPALRIMHLDVSDDCAVREAFSKLEQVNVVLC